MGQESINSKDRLKWYLRFLNLKIAGLSEKELFAIWAEIREIAYGEFGPFVIPDASLLEWEKRKEEGRAIQDQLKRCLGKIINPTKISLTLGKPFKKMQLASYPKLLENKGFESGDNILKYHAFTHDFEVQVKAMDQKVFLYFQKVEDKLLLDFISVLSQFSLDLIRKCQREDCGAYFLKGTQKEKRYCSDRCAWIMASRKRWAEKKSKARESSTTPTTGQRFKKYRKINLEKKGGGK